MQTLEVINAMLLGVSQLPVSSIESTHPFVSTALAIFNGEDRAVQARGWWFNKDYNVVLTPNASKNIVLPDTVLSVDPVNPNNPLLQRGGMLYDPITRSTTFDRPVKVNLISRLTFEDLPEPAAMYIKNRCVMAYFLNFDGERAKLEILAQLAEQSRQELVSEQLRVLRVNLVDNPQYRLLVGRFANSTDGRIYIRRGAYSGN